MEANQAIKCVTLACAGFWRSDFNSWAACLFEEHGIPLLLEIDGALISVPQLLVLAITCRAYGVTGLYSRRGFNPIWFPNLRSAMPSQRDIVLLASCLCSNAVPRRRQNRSVRSQGAGVSGLHKEVVDPIVDVAFDPADRPGAETDLFGEAAFRDAQVNGAPGQAGSSLHGR